MARSTIGVKPTTFRRSEILMSSDSIAVKSEVVTPPLHESPHGLELFSDWMWTALILKRLRLGA